MSAQRLTISIDLEADSAVQAIVKLSMALLTLNGIQNYRIQDETSGLIFRMTDHDLPVH